MKVKLYVVLFCLTLTVVAVTVTGSSINRHRSTTQEEAGSGLAWYVRRAKAQGKSEITVPAPRTRLAVARSLDEALSSYTAVIATPIESKSFIFAPHIIATWYKFKVVEYLTQKGEPACPTCAGPVEVPAELPALDDNEILVLRPSGTVVLDGVKLTSRESGFPPFREAQQYLLFLNLDPSSRVGRLRMGPYGVFTVGPGGDLQSITGKSHPFKGDLEPQEGKGSALEQLRAKAQHRQ